MNQIFSYTKRDYEGARKEGLAKIPILSSGLWTDLNATDPGIILLDYVHALVDMVQYYQDHNALEVFLSTAKERKNIFRIVKQLSYKVRSAKGAKLDVKFYVKELYDKPIRIPKYTSIQTSEGVEYLTTRESYINANEISTIVPCVQGTIKRMNYQGTGISKYTDSFGISEDQTVLLAEQNVDIDSISINDSTGRIWNAVDHIVFSESDDRVYQKDLNPDGTILITFGDGERGKLLTDTDVLVIEYIASLAEEGRVGIGAVNELNDDLYDIAGNQISVYVTNPEPSTGGSGPQSEEDIKAIAPGVIKAQDRAVTLGDFEALARQVEGVSSAIAYDINRAPDLCLYHEVKVLVVPEDNYSTESLVQTVYDYLYSRMIPPTNLSVMAPSELIVDIEITVVRDKLYLEGGLQYSIQEVIESYFYDKSKSVGSSFTPNELISRISNVAGVRYVESISPNQELTTNTLSVLKLGNIQINVKE